MCFYKDPRHWEVKTATRDMICYKGIRVYPETEDLYAVYHLNYKYTLNKLLRSRLDRDGMRFVYCGFHSFSSKKAAEFRKREWREQFTSTSLYIKIFVCIIPAGSNYFWNPDRGEYVSNRLIVTNEVITSSGIYTSFKKRLKRIY